MFLIRVIVKGDHVRMYFSYRSYFTYIFQCLLFSMFHTDIPHAHQIENSIGWLDMMALSIFLDQCIVECNGKMENCSIGHATEYTDST